MAETTCRSFDDATDNEGRLLDRGRRMSPERRRTETWKRAASDLGLFSRL